MALIRCFLCASLILIAFRGSHAQEVGEKPPKPDPGEPDLVITPHTIRVQPFDPDE